METLTLDQFWDLHKSIHEEIVAEFRASGNTAEQNQAYWTEQMSNWYENLINDAFYSTINTDEEVLVQIKENLSYIKPNSKFLRYL